MPIPPFPVRTKRGLTIRVGTSDPAVYAQVMLSEEYGICRGLSNIRTIVDGGANVGYTATYFADLFPDASIICVEPDARNARVCRSNVQHRATVLETAIWPTPARLAIHDASANAWGIQVRADESGAIQAITMPELVEMCGGCIDLLKLDIEGAEKDLFSGDTSWLGSVRNIVMEIHDGSAATVEAALSRFSFERGSQGELTSFFNLRPL